MTLSKNLYTYFLNGVKNIARTKFIRVYKSNKGFRVLDRSTGQWKTALNPNPFLHRHCLLFR